MIMKGQITQKKSKGYKQTEIGVIPEDWDVNKVGEMVDVVGGGTPSTIVSKYWNGTIDWFTPTEIGMKKYAYQSKRKITKEGFKNSSTKILNEGTVLLTSRAGIGDLAILKTKACTNQGFQSLSPHEAIDGEFLYYLMLTKKNALLDKASGSTFLEISPNNVRNILIQVPKKQEQTVIATVLSDADALIESLEKMITKKKAIKQGAMQQLLTGKKRLPGFSGKWEMKKLGKIGEIITGSTPPTQIKEYWNGSIPWITPTDISDKKDIYNSEREISPLGLQVIRKLPANTLLVTCIASIGKNAILRENGACNQQINAIIPNENSDVDFLYYLIENNKQYLLGNAGITATLIISKKYFSEIAFSFPKDKSEQTVIATILSDMDAEIERLEKKRDKYIMLKLGMMQQLLTGRIRLYANN